MKLLIYGIDGGDLAVMKKFPMPFLRRFLEENTSIELTSDLINRGWAEILTGQGAHETGAFYMAPILDGTHRCSTSFRMSQLKGHSGVKPLWELFDEKGISFLMMNVPTSTPDPNLKNGIIVGSAGGGLNKVEGVPAEIVSDKSILPLLNDKNYIVDIRIPNSDYEKTSDMLDSLVVMEERRTDCFVELCKQRNMDAGFLANTGTRSLVYLATSEIESYDAYETLEEFMPRHLGKSWMHRKLEEHFEMLDKQIERLYNELKPEHFIITADHGLVPHKTSANISHFLKDNGYLRSSKPSAFIPFLRKIKNGLGLQRFSEKVVTQLPSAAESLTGIDWRKSVAFGANLCHGIFINDKDRFNGPVAARDLDRVVDEIVDKFNALEPNLRAEMVAVQYRRKYDGAFACRMPDIVLDNSEGICFYDSVACLTAPNPGYGPISEKLADVGIATFSGAKGEHPICLVSKDIVRYLETEDTKDLTLVYRLAERLIR